MTPTSQYNQPTIKLESLNKLSSNTKETSHFQFVVLTGPYTTNNPVS